jgi:hypothetical protein
MNKKNEIYFETIVCMVLGIVLLSIATYIDSLPREVRLTPKYSRYDRLHICRLDVFRGYGVVHNRSC